MKSEFEHDQAIFEERVDQALRNFLTVYDDNPKEQKNHLRDRLELVLIKHMELAVEQDDANLILIKKFFPAVFARFCFEVSPDLLGLLMINYIDGNPEYPKSGSQYESEINAMLCELDEVKNEILELQNNDSLAAFFDYISLKIEEKKNSREPILKALMLPDGRAKNLSMYDLPPVEASDFTPEMRGIVAKKLIEKFREKLSEIINKLERETPK